MRTFHVGGTAQIKEDSSVVSVNSGILKVSNKNLLEDSKNNIIVMGRNTQLSLEDDNGRQLAFYKVPYGSRLFFKSCVGASLFAMFGQGAIPGGRTPSPTQNGPFALYSASPRRIPKPI